MADATWRIEKWFPELDQRCIERLRIYHLELLRWTNTVNLISPKTQMHADRIHFADSILGSRAILVDCPEAKEFWDLGSGGGFPGVVISILRPEVGVYCVDSDERKSAFIKQLSLRLDLENLVSRCERVERLPSDSIEIAVSRAFAPLSKSLLLAGKAVIPGGKYYQFKGTDVAQEISASLSLRSTWNTLYVASYELPVGEILDEASGPRSIVKSHKAI